MAEVVKAKRGQSCGLQDALELVRDVAVIERAELVEPKTKKIR